VSSVAKTASRMHVGQERTPATVGYRAAKTGIECPRGDQLSSPMTATIEVDLRQADDDDLPFLLALRRQTMTEHEAAVGKLRSPTEVHARVMAAFEAARIILLQGAPVGMMKVVQTDREWKVAQLQIAPEHQRRGIGSLLLHRLRAEARDAGATLTLSVLKSNPALRLYVRQGFSVIGESSTAYNMRIGDSEK